MDLYCQKCGEPWDQYGVYNGDMSVLEKDNFLRGIDCPGCAGKKVCTKKENCSECLEHDDEKHECQAKMVKRPARAEIAKALAGILGDDTDGLAAEMEDAEALLGSDFWSES